MKQVPLPKAVKASDLALWKASAISSPSLTTLIPRPPPPKAALIMTGNPYFSTKACASSTLSIGPGVPGTVGTPAASAKFLALTLSPTESIILFEGPIQVIPAASTFPANSEFSDKKP
ncbi:hypothetical protein WICMUC_004220 [Wickerhamomyces mucosus]|uniref:Uncharacterized protein n=1 Tax=Wickerhamomyces mucosus TaxID=1378264 RepID=A0A9P8PJ69_9ASCO|nr:hypothetical protein WICMUC_004220 [Wickerhamomyces mucosus]